jgi:hypothetical protein
VGESSDFRGVYVGFGHSSKCTPSAAGFPLGRADADVLDTR